MAVFLAVRQIGRRPTALREGRTLVIAVTLACFAVSAWSVARSNRVIAATFSVGARTVVTVTPEHGTLEQAVDTVDPRGRFAMAAMQVSGPGMPLVAVDAKRLPVAAAWPGGTTRESVAAVSRALTPRTVAEVNLANGPIAVSADVSSSGAASRALPHVRLAAWLFDRVDGTFTRDLGSLRPGRSTYQGVASTHCPCRLVGLGVLPAATRLPSSGQIGVAVNALTYRSPDGPQGARAELKPADWRSSLTGVNVRATGSELAIEIPMTAVTGEIGLGGIPPVMASLGGELPVIPAVAGSVASSLAVGSGQHGALPAQGLDGYSISVHPAIAAASLPRIGRGGVIVDLGALERAQTAATSSFTTSEEVWLGPAAPADAVSRLRAAGLRIDRVERSSTLVAQAKHTGPTLAYDFMLLATLVALLVAAVGTFSVLAAGGRQRAAEMSALEVTGVRRLILVRALAIEAGILALTALFGVVAGAGSAAVVLPSLPQLAGGTDAPLSYALPVGLLVAAAAGAVLVVMLATALAARGILSSMSPTLLRNAADDVA